MATVYADEAAKVIAGQRASRFKGATLKMNAAVMELPVSAVNDVAVLLGLPSNAVPVRIVQFSDALTAGAGNLGLARMDPKTGAIVAQGTAGILGATGSMASAIANVDKLAARAGAVDTIGETPLWKLAGYAKDPGGELWLTLTITTATTAAGTVRFNVEYF